MVFVVVAVSAHEICPQLIVQSVVVISMSGRLLVSIPSRSTFDGVKPRVGAFDASLVAASFVPPPSPAPASAPPQEPW
jgi:hypothetical protein